MVAGKNDKRGAGPIALLGAYIGSVIGAGFASGQEHLVFFLRFGRDGVWGIGLAGLMLMAFGVLLLVLAHRHQTRAHTQLLGAIAAPPVAALFDGILSLFVLSSLSVMMAGSGALVHTLTGAPELLGVIGMALATLVMLLLRVERMLWINALLTAVLVGMILWVAGAALPYISLAEIEAIPSIESWVPASWILAAALYGSYNLALSLSLFGALGSEIHDVKAAVYAGIGGGAVLTLVGLGVYVAVASSLPAAAKEAVPMSHAALRLGPAAHAVYTGAIGLAMLTTAVASSYTLTRRLKHLLGASQGFCSLAVIAAGIPMAALGFGRLVATLYPLIGYVGAGCLILAALAGRRKSG